MKKTMRKSALLSSVAMLIVSAIVLTSATYAWFSSSKVVTVEELSAEVKVSTGLLISVYKGADWSTSVDFAKGVAVKAGWGTGIPATFDPVSSADAKSWITAIYDEDTDALTVSEALPGTEGDFVAVPLWVTGPVGETVNATITWNVDSQAAKCVKFALLPSADGENPDSYTQAVPVEANDPTGFMGVSAAGTTTAADGAFVTDGGANIAEITEADLTFTIPEGTSTTQPIKYIAYIWLEGNDKDCDMLEFETSGEKIEFSMQLALAE